MLKPLLLAPIALVGLASASPPPMGAPRAAVAQDYPPCSATVIDRCVQTYERGRRHASREASAPPAEPLQVAGDYPPCSATVTDRCQQGVRRAGPTRYARWERDRVRIGERG